MKLFFQIIFKIFLTLTIFAGCATTGEIKETDSTKLANQGIAFIEEGQYELAIDCFNKAIAINPKYAVAYNNRGIVYTEKGEYRKATSDFNKAIEINPWYAMAYNNRGFVYTITSQYDMAITDASIAIKLNPTLCQCQPYIFRGIAYSEQGQYDMACSDWKRACELGVCKFFEASKMNCICQ
jgi:tetratricopeptide (TPR) repeat protein